MTNEPYAGLVFLIILAGGGYFAGPPLLGAGTGVFIVAVVFVVILVIWAWSALEMHLFKRRLERSTELFWDRKNKGLQQQGRDVPVARLRGVLPVLRPEIQCHEGRVGRV